MRESFAIGHPFPDLAPATNSNCFIQHINKKSTLLLLKAMHQAQPGRKGMPEEQSVRAREGAADPQGCGNPLRSGIPFLTLHQQPTAIVLFNTSIKSPLFCFSKRCISPTGKERYA